MATVKNKNSNPNAGKVLFLKGSDTRVSTVRVGGIKHFLYPDSKKANTWIEVGQNETEFRVPPATTSSKAKRLEELVQQMYDSMTPEQKRIADELTKKKTA